MKNLKELTLDEYYKMIREFFLSSEKDRVIKIVCDRGALHYLVKPNLIPKKKFIDICWNYEPLMKRYYNSKEEMIDDIVLPKKVNGYVLRWLFGGEFTYQITCVGNVDNFVKEYKRDQNQEYLYGLRLDPFTYIGPVFYEKDKDGNDTNNFETHRSEYKENSNYRIYYVELTPDEFIKEEALYTNPEIVYKDDYFIDGKLTKLAKTFFINKTNWKD
jgi:hypothetical protein